MIRIFHTKGRSMATFLVAHGAWSAGWAWKKMRPLLRARGHELYTPTHTGLGERSHLAHAGIDLDAHIADILAVLQFEDLRDVVLVGHSYGGMVATGAADRAADRIARLVYLDAFVPRDGQSLFDLVGEAATAIRDMWVRGAPLIGVTAAYLVLVETAKAIFNRRFGTSAPSGAVAGK